MRRLIESGDKIQLVVTTTGISRDLSEQSAPFYGFFNVFKLEPFETDEAIDYLRRRAEVTGDDEFLAELNNPERSDMLHRRVMSIEQLAGGQPRIWALLSEGLDSRDHDAATLEDKSAT